MINESNHMSKYSKRALIICLFSLFVMVYSKCIAQTNTSYVEEKAMGVIILICVGVLLFWKMIEVWDERDVEDPFDD